MPSASLRLARSGFSLAEMVVTISILAVLAAAVVPAVLQQVDKGETTRVAKDLKNVGEAAKFFNADVQRWPGSLEVLSIRPTATSTDAYGSPLPADLVVEWEGPYIDRGGQVSSGLTTGYNGTVRNAFEVGSWNGSEFLVVVVLNISPADAAKVDVMVDGANDPAGGQIRHDGVSTMRFFSIPIMQP